MTTGLADLSDDGALSTLPHQQPNPVGPNLHPMHHHAIYSEPIFTLDNKTVAAAAAAGEEFSGKKKMISSSGRWCLDLIIIIQRARVQSLMEIHGNERSPAQ